MTFNDFLSKTGTFIKNSAGQIGDDFQKKKELRYLKREILEKMTFGELKYLKNAYDISLSSNILDAGEKIIYNPTTGKHERGVGLFYCPQNGEHVVPTMDDILHNRKPGQKAPEK